jgi:hypothetical protein
MARYVLPNLPSLIFYALQAQISIFLISLFGQTRSIAEVGALGRLTQIFVLLAGFNGVVIEPFMARLPKERVLRNYLLVLSVATAIGVVLSSLGFLEPKFILLLLGPKYAGLQKEAGWLIFGSCLGYLMSIAWTMAAARRWVYWTTSWVSIGMIIATQLIFLSFFKLNSTLDVIYFGVATSASQLAAVLFNGVYGYVKGPKIHIPEAVQEQQIEAEHVVEQIAQSEVV